MTKQVVMRTCSSFKKTSPKSFYEQIIIDVNLKKLTISSERKKEASILNLIALQKYLQNIQTLLLSIIKKLLKDNMYLDGLKAAVEPKLEKKKGS